ncbi:hypothetical protein [Haloglomus salinum]|uniref:hypothetical protein n=1 Tax=Haloglomus salinum TaxID=2962673 RepID=UPI0020C97B80|nr:hypothetical protein [Haloglomus salinum]
MLLRIPNPSIAALVPGMAPGTHKRNVLVLLVYLLVSFVVLSATGIGMPTILR